MNNCTKYAELISCFYDGEITDAEKSELENHLEQCPSCRSLFEIYSYISDGAGELEESPDALRENVMAEIKSLENSNKTVRLRRYIRIRRYIGLAACIALILMILPVLQKIKSPASDGTMADFGADDGTESNIEAEGMPAPQGAPQSSSDMNESLEMFYDAGGNKRNAEYYAVITLEGALPELLSDYDKEDAGGGVLYIYITSEVAEELVSEGYAVVYGDESINEALVIYTAE